jgi:DNA-binding PadR family transcriptional regulator
VHPGSIYNALRQLTRAGLLEELPATSEGARPARTSYRLTPLGEEDYLAALRAALRSVDDPTAFATAVNFSRSLPRAEVVEAIEDLLTRLRQGVTDADGVVAQILAARDTPDSASEVARIARARTVGEIAWAEDYLERVRAGAYSFAGEPADWHPSDEAVAAALAEGALVDPEQWTLHREKDT